MWHAHCAVLASVQAQHLILALQIAGFDHKSRSWQVSGCCAWASGKWGVSDIEPNQLWPYGTLLLL